MSHIIVNEKKIILLKNDTETTLRERIASHFETLPFFFEKFNFPQNKEKITIRFLKDDIINSDDVSFNDFIKNNDILTVYPPINIDILTKYWISNNKHIRKNEALYLIAEEDFKKIGVKTDIALFIRDEEGNFISSINNKILENKQKTNEFTKIFKKINSLEPFDSIPFKKEKSILNIKTNISNDISLNTIFHYIQCNSDVPFASFSGIYKIYKDIKITPPKDWSISQEDFIILKCLNKTFYSDCIILFIDNVLTINININYSESTIDELKQKILSSLINLQMTITEETEEQLSGITFFPKQNFNVYIMSDFIMNNSIASTFMAVDESKKASKTKAGLYLHFFIGQEEGTCSIISKQAEKTDQEIKNVDRKIISLGEDFIRLRVSKAKNIEIIDSFIQNFSKLLRLYYESRDEIIGFYKKYIPSFGKEGEEKGKKQYMISNRDLVPELFVSGYSRRCPNPPKIVDEEYKAKNEQIMLFPKTPEEGPQNYYVCEDEKYAYIGLRINNLKNKERYQYIPCCYEKDQLSKKNSGYNAYLNNLKKNKGAQQNILVTDKFVFIDEFAQLPKNINNLFYSLDSNFEYFRKGVHNTKFSFLECVLEGALEDFSRRTRNDKLKILNREFESIVGYENMAVASQENPGYSVEQMRESLVKEPHMDPRRWIRLCEVIYDCKIFIFSKKPDSMEGIMETPNFKGIYLSYNQKQKKTVFIYEHTGSESDRSFYPRCELIVKWNKSVDVSDIHYSFNGKIIEKYTDFLQKCVKQYYFNQIQNKITQINYFGELPQIFVSQIIDSYGKARGLLTKDGFILLTDPIPPLNLPLTNIIKNSVSSAKNIFDFIKKNGFNLKSQYIVKNTIKEINIVFNNYHFTIKTDIPDYKLDAPLELNQKYPDFGKIVEGTYDSTGNTMYFNKIKKISSILLEYFVYMYSDFVKNNEICLESIKDFVENKILLKEKNEYIVPLLPFIYYEYLEENNFVRDGKLIVPSNDVLRKLIYSLRLRIVINLFSVREYHKKHEITDFYVYIDQYLFKNDTNTIITQNLDNLQRIDNIIYNKIQHNEDKYFLRNKYINNDVPLYVVREKDLKEAKIKSIKKDEGEIYLYNSSKNIKKIKTDKGSVLVYKKDGKVNYLSILSFLS